MSPSPTTEENLRQPDEHERSVHEVTQLLNEWNDGNKQALDELAPLVERELKRLAHQYLNRERKGHTLQTTDLVHEAWIKLMDQSRVNWQNRAHFYGVAAQLMRRILVDHARRYQRDKRGGGAPMVPLDQELKVPLDQALFVSNESLGQIIAIDEALDRLAEIDPRKARVVELRFFVGLDVKETASVLGVSEITVTRDWEFAKTWLHRELS